jgi:hypothetical protein
MLLAAHFAATRSRDESAPRDRSVAKAVTRASGNVVAKAHVLQLGLLGLVGAKKMSSSDCRSSAGETGRFECERMGWTARLMLRSVAVRYEQALARS